ncbi:hypothetical protein GJ744_000533 [Endocarpon pusillum]|uniref:FAD-binding PCMH-type domain-containing protein n=1 Tax=Endocarpon pusillum TaxID=364733 RepID=A0A8H7ADT9_9EURO|nr:hypothetical protein GJ744_000533 [Endocarpon pusillum]
MQPSVPYIKVTSRLHPGQGTVRWPFEGPWYPHVYLFHNTQSPQMKTLDLLSFAYPHHRISDEAVHLQIPRHLSENLLRIRELHAKQMPRRVDAIQTRICLSGMWGIGKASHQAPNFWWLSPEFQSPGGGLGLGCSNGFSAFDYSSASRRRCAFGDKCWPDDSTWQAFNDSVSGHLIRSVPSAAVCHHERYDAGLCDTAQKEWRNSLWRTNQTGAYSAILWELGSDQCFINTPRDAPCDAGLVPHYSVAVQGVEDVQKAVKFAHDRDLYLVVKNTGHSHLGRSSGKGSFSIWTHNLKGKEWRESFVPKGAPGGTSGVHAVTLQAGEQWLDVYRAAAEQNVIVVGGHARTVGSAGGYLTGGGHSPFAYFYGLAVDNLLEVDLVTADGSYQTINAYTDPDYFYALRGGGGSAWGVITSVTYRTHPNPAHIQVGLMQFNTTDESTLRNVLHKALQALPAVTDAGYTGYGIMDDGSFAALFVQPNATEEIFNTTFAPFYELASHANVSAQVGSISFPTWIDYCNTFLMDPNIATNIIDASRLLTSDDLLERTTKLVDVVLEFDEFSAGFNFIGKVNSTERDNTAVHPAWKDSRAVFSLGTDWADDASGEERLRKKQQAVEISKRLGEIVGPDGGTYVNEANPYEPDWQNVFWGPKYDRLLSIKKRIDPTNLFVCNRCVGTDVLFKP